MFKGQIRTVQIFIDENTLQLLKDHSSKLNQRLGIMHFIKSLLKIFFITIFAFIGH